MYSELVKFKVTMSYDGYAPHWNKAYATFGDAVKAYETFTDWGFADEFATITLHAGEYVTSKTYRRPN